MAKNNKPTDDWQVLDDWQEVSEDKGPKTSAAQTALEKFANTATLGYLPHMQAAAGSAMGLGDYTQLRDENIARQKLQSEEHPMASAAGTVGGMVAGAVLPGSALSKAAKGASALGKVGLGALQGAVTGAVANPGDEEGVVDLIQASERLSNAALGGAIGGGVQGLLQVPAQANKLLKSVSKRAARFNPSQAEAYVRDPKGTKELARMLDNPARADELQDMAKGAIQDARKTLKVKGLEKAKNLRELLTGKQVEINPSQLRGLSKEADDIIASQIDPMLSHRPTIKVDANIANKVKQSLQEAAKYPQGTMVDPVQAAKIADAGRAASGIRTALEQVGGPKVSDLNRAMQESVLTQEMLRKGLKNSPIATLTSESADKLASIARADKAANAGLLSFGSKLGAAKAMQRSTETDNLQNAIVKALGRAGLRAANKADGAISKTQDPQNLQALLNLIFSNQE